MNKKLQRILDEAITKEAVEGMDYLEMIISILIYKHILDTNYSENTKITELGKIKTYIRSKYPAIKLHQLPKKYNPKKPIK